MSSLKTSLFSLLFYCMELLEVLIFELKALWILDLSYILHKVILPFKSGAFILFEFICLEFILAKAWVLSYETFLIIGCSSFCLFILLTLSLALRKRCHFWSTLPGEFCLYHAFLRSTLFFDDIILIHHKYLKCLFCFFKYMHGS